MEYRLEELFDLQMGKTPSRNNLEYWNTNNNKWISISDLSKCGKYIDTTKEYISDKAVYESGITQIPKKTVIMSFKLSIGKTAITAEPMYSNEAIISFRDKHITELLPEYIYYLILSKDWSIGINKAVMGKTLNKATLSKIKVNIHNISQQNEIVKILNKVNNVISARKQQLQKLDELVKSRFIEMFGDPVENPKNWNKRSLLDMGTCKNGLNYRPGETGVSVYCLGVGDFKDLSVIDDVSKLSKIELEKPPSEVCMLKDDDIVFVRSNGNKALVGRCLAVYPQTAQVVHSGFCIRYRRNCKDLDTAYLLSVLKSDSMRMKMAGHGANIQNLNQKILASLDIPIPPLSLQNEFAEFVKLIDKSKFIIQKSLDETQLLFDSLMQKYFN